MNRVLAVSSAAICALALAGYGSLSTAVQAADQLAPALDAGQRHRLEQTALSLGLQVASKHAELPQSKVAGKAVNAANPYLGSVADPAQVDYSYWADYLAGKSAQRAQIAQAVTPFVYHEQEPRGKIGSNDTQRHAERITRFGIGGGKKPAVRVLGELSPPVISTDRIGTREDQGAIPIATRTGIPSQRDGVEVTSRIGDGPHGTAGDGTGDFDFFKVSASAGEAIISSTAGSRFDTILVVYDAAGNELAANDDAGGTLQSKLAFTVPSSGDYYVLVTGFLSLPDDPFDSGSGPGAGDEGPYSLTVRVGNIDSDYYAVNLKPGDVLAGTIDGDAFDIVVHKFNGAERVGSTQDISFIYPIESPLPGGGNGAFAYVAEQAGLYAVSTSQGDGRYRMALEAYRPATNASGKRVVQKLFLDFDGQRVNTAIFGGSGVSQLSPLSAFLRRWGLPSSALNPVINRVVATVKENVEADLRARGLNDDFRVQILNSRDHPDTFGRPNVSRVIVGGTIAESGVDTIGIAQSIDPGNFESKETALVLLDILSSRDRTDDASLNAYLRPSSDKIKFIGSAVGNVTSHEIGHYIGSFHVDQFNRVLNLMDQGGNFPLLYGVGNDGVGGTADDPDVDFGVDTLNPNEGFTGREDTLNNSAWASSWR